MVRLLGVMKNMLQVIRIRRFYSVAKNLNAASVDRPSPFTFLPYLQSIQLNYIHPQL